MERREHFGGGEVAKRVRITHLLRKRQPPDLSLLIKRPRRAHRLIGSVVRAVGREVRSADPGEVVDFSHHYYY